MTTINFVEDLVNALILGNSKEIINIIEKEIDSSDKKGNIVVAKRLRSLVSKIPKKFFSAQGFNFPSPENKLTSSLVEEINSKILLEDVVLEDQAKIVVSEFLREWEDFDKLSKHGLSPVNRIIFHGPPGTGKTKLAHAIANKLDFPLLIVNLDELISSFLGKTGKNIKEIFDLAINGKVIIFLDEIDAVAKHRDDDRELGELKRVVTVLLQKIDTFPNGSILLGATNHGHLLDPALWRRFPLKIQFDLPSEQARENLFELFLDDVVNKSFDYKLMARISKNFNGSLINDICHAAKKHAILNDSKVSDLDVLKQTLLHASQRFMNSKGTISKKTMYNLCQMFKDNGYSVIDIAKLSKIPYTTLRDNLK